jgi:membrane protein DedA with SNARE-associated domain
MESIISNLGHFISDHRVWAGPIVGVIAFGESLAIIGMFIPATPIMIAIGGLVGAGIIEPLPVIIGAIIGAVIGDIISYFLGWWLGRNIIHKWPLNKHRSGVGRGRPRFPPAGAWRARACCSAAMAFPPSSSVVFSGLCAARCRWSPV